MNRKGNVEWLVIGLSFLVGVLLFFLLVIKPDAWYFKTSTITKDQLPGTWPQNYVQNLGDAHSGWQHGVGFCQRQGVIEQPDTAAGNQFSITDQDKIYIFKYLGVFDPQWCAGKALLSEVSS